MSRFSTLALALLAAGALGLSGCKVKPAKNDGTKPVLTLTVRDNASKQNTVVSANNKAAPYKLGAKYDVMLSVNATDAQGGMSQLIVSVSHYMVSCSVKPGGPKADKPESYSIDSQTATGAKDSTGKVQSELIYVKFLKASEVEGRFCQTIKQGGSIYYPTIDAGGLIQVHAYAKNFDGTQADQQDWYLQRP
jgi:hypothetical protein